MKSSTSLGSAFMVVEGNRDIGLVADIVFILNWLISILDGVYFGFQLEVSSFFS